jgi:hypothetical protein
MFCIVVATSVDRICVWRTDCENFLLYNQQFVHTKCVCVFVYMYICVCLCVYMSSLHPWKWLQ